MAQRIEPGKYEARLLNYQMGETKVGKAQAELLFAFKDKDGDEHELVWYGSYASEKAQEITLKALLVCGLKGNESWKIAGGPESGVLDLTTPVQIEVVMESGKNGKTYPKVRWINRLGGTKFQQGGKLSPEQAKAKLLGLNLEGATAHLRKELGVPDAPKRAIEPPAEQQDYDPDYDSGLPF